MPDLQHAVDEIRLYLQSSNRTDDSRLEGLARSFADKCNQANDRLRRCGKYLREGLTTEAICLAETEPTLLKMITVLDFPERADWDEVVAMYDLPRAPGLLEDAAGALNQAYTHYQALEPLMTRHHLLALARGPIADRLEVTRRIAALEPQNAFWHDDIQALESRRLKELEVEVAGLTNRGALTEVARLESELNTQPWRSPIPANLFHMVEAAKYSLTTAALQTFAADLEKAYKEKNIGTATNLLNRFRKTAESINLAPFDPLWDQIKPARTWIKRRERYTRVLKELDTAFQSEVTFQYIKDLYSELAACGFGVPADVREALRTIKRRRRWKWVHNALAIIGALVAILAVSLIVLPILHALLTH